MDAWLALAKGPLFAFSILVMLLGLGRHVVLQVQGLVTRKGSLLRGAPWGRMTSRSLSWALPVVHLGRHTALMTVASFAFHLGAVVVPLFLAAHVGLWERFSGLSLPALSALPADVLTGLTLLAIPVLAAYRLLVRRARDISRGSDFFILALVFLPFGSGFVAAHPAIDPLPWSVMMLVHALSADLLLVLVPFTKLAHVVLFPFNRFSEVHWQLRPGAGERVAQALFGEEARV